MRPSTGPATSSPQLLEEGAPLYGYVADGYWEDVGTHESYLKAQADVLDRKVDVEIDGFEVSPGVWVAEGAEVDPEAVLKGPLYVGDYAKVEAGAELREYTVLGSNVVVKAGAFLHRAVVHDNVFIGPGSNLRGCVDRQEHRRHARRPGSRRAPSSATSASSRRRMRSSRGVKVYPFKTIEAGAVVNTSVIWESRGQRTLFGPRGVSGLVNVEITPELAVRLASAYATTLKKGATVTTSRDASRAARALKRAVIARSPPAPSTCATSRSCRCRWPASRPPARTGAGGIVIRTTPGDPQSVDIVFLDEHGADLSQAAPAQAGARLRAAGVPPRVPGEIADLPSRPGRGPLHGGAAALRRHHRGPRGRAQGRVDTAGRQRPLWCCPACSAGSASRSSPVNNRLDEASPTETLAERMRDLRAARRAGRVRRGPAFGVRFDPVGERISLVDENGALISDDRALLVVLDLVAAERRGGRVALPVTTTRVAEQVCRFHGSRRVDLDLAGRADPGGRRAGRDLRRRRRGGFVVPEFSPAVDGIAAFVRLSGLVARTRLTLSRSTRGSRRRTSCKPIVPTPWAAKGMVMREVVEAAGDRSSTPPTASGWSRRTAAGRWCCPTRPRRSPTCGPRARTPRRRPGAARGVGRRRGQCRAVAHAGAGQVPPRGPVRHAGGAIRR